MKKKVLNVGIIGAGFMGSTHTYNYLNMPLFYDDLPFRIQLVGICDTDLDKARQLKKNFGYKFATDNYMDLIERDDIDIIDVSTPTIFHYQQIVKSIEAEKHVYVDKPLCATPGEAEEVVALAEKTGLVYQVAYNYRFYPAMMKAKMLIDEGFLGRGISFRIVYYHSSNLDPDKPMGWKQDRAMGGGGVMIEMACHALDLMYHFLGKYESARMESMILYPKRPDKNGNIVEVRGEDHVLLTIRMKNGMLGTAEVSKVMTGTNDDLNFEIYGTKGALKFEMMHPNFLWVYDSMDACGTLGGSRGFKAVETINRYPESKSNFPGPRFGIGWIRGHVACQYNFVRCVHEGVPASPSFSEGAYIQKVTGKIYEGAETMGGI